MNKQKKFYSNSGNKKKESKKFIISNNFTTASDLLNRKIPVNNNYKINNNKELNNSFSFEELLQTLIKNIETISVLQTIDPQIIKNEEIGEMYFVLTVINESSKSFNCKIEFLGKKGQNDDLIHVITIQIKNKNTFRIIKENLHFFLSINHMEQILITLGVNK